jgi:DNA end-binding protein Ku
MAPPRAIWTGTISFGLVNAPVRMYTAVREKDLRFNMLHEKDGGRIGYQRICKVDGKEVTQEEIVKGYDLGGGEYVQLTADDFAAAAQENHRTITIQDFVPADQIDPIYFERTYYLGPQEGAGEPIYALLAKAMEDSGLSAIATYIQGDREHLACLRVRDEVITLERMFFHDEVRETEGLAPSLDSVDKRQLKMANDLIKAYTGEFDPTQYEDTYRARLLSVIEQKSQGKKVKAPKLEEGAAPPDLMAALTASLDEARKARAARGKSKSSSGGGARKTKASAGGGRRKTAAAGRKRG